MINLKWLTLILLGMICCAKAKVAPDFSSLSQREMTLVDGFGHYETARFVEPLKKAVPWIKKIWKE